MCRRPRTPRRANECTPVCAQKAMVAPAEPGASRVYPASHPPERKRWRRGGIVPKSLPAFTRGGRPQLTDRETVRAWGRAASCCRAAGVRRDTSRCGRDDDGREEERSHGSGHTSPAVDCRSLPVPGRVGLPVTWRGHMPWHGICHRCLVLCLAVLCARMGVGCWEIPVADSRVAAARRGPRDGGSARGKTK